MPVARVQLPDGRIARLEVPEGTTPEQVEAFLQQQGQPKPSAPTEQAGYSAKDALAPWDAGLHFATGAVGSVAGGLAGLVSTVVPGVDSADVVRSTQEAMTYQPRTKLGGQMADAAGAVLSLPAKGANVVGEGVTDATGSPALGTAANVAVQSIPAIVGSRGVAALRNNALAREADNSVTNATLRDATNNGYVVPPSQMAQTGLGKGVAGVVESVAGPEALERAMSVRNTKTVNAGARADAGIPGRGQIAEADIEAASAPYFAVYEQARAVSPRANAAVEAWRKANDMVRKYRKQNAVQYTVAGEEAQIAAAKRAENRMKLIEREAAANKQPDLARKLRDARVALGKIGTVERALNEATGNVSAQSLKQARDKGVPIQNNPNMNRAANVSEAFRGRLTQPPPVRGQNMSGAAMLAAALGGPKAIAWSGLPWAVRLALMSRPVQAMARPRVPDPALSRTNQLNRAAAISALQQEQE